MSWCRNSETLCVTEAALLGQRLLSQEAVNRAGGVEVWSDHRAVRSYAGPGEHGATWNVVLNNGAVSIAHKTVKNVCIVDSPPRDRSIRINIPGKCSLVGARPTARSIECRHRAILIEQEAVIHADSVNEDPQDGSIRSKAAAIRTLARTRAPTRKIECGDDAILIPQ